MGVMLSEDRFPLFGIMPRAQKENGAGTSRAVSNR